MAVTATWPAEVQPAETRATAMASTVSAAIPHVFMMIHRPPRSLGLRILDCTCFRSCPSRTGALRQRLPGTELDNPAIDDCTTRDFHQRHRLHAVEPGPSGGA